MHFWVWMIAGMLLAVVASTVALALLARVARSPKPAAEQRSWWARVKAHVRGSPYGHHFPGQLRVLDSDGKVLDSRAALVLVSRHGLRGSGVVCPECHTEAAKAGEWDKIAQTAWGEAICCLSCHKMLLASPDDDVDPVRPGQKYDESVYHKFARPPGLKRPRQRTLLRDPVISDWVAIRDFVWTKADGTTQDLDRGEGRVTAIVDGRAILSLVQGMGESVTVTIPIANVRPMASDTLTKGDRVTITRGAYQGKPAIVQGAKEATISVAVEGGDGSDIDVPIEHLSKIHE